MKRKKIVENCNKPTTTTPTTATAGTTGPATTDISPEDDSSSCHCSPPGYNSSRQSPGGEETEAPRVPITFSWPSLEVEVEGQEVVSVHTQEEARDQRPDPSVAVTVGLKNNFNRISSACDSGYSELDIYSTAAQETTHTMNVVKEESLNNCDKSYLDEFQLYFNLDKMLERTSHEENCFKELDLSFSYSEETEACSCPVSPAESLDLHLSPSDSSLTNRPTTVISIAQGFSTTNIQPQPHQPNVSKKYLESLPGNRRPTKPIRVIRRDSSQSLPVMSAPTESLLNDLRRLSLPKVTADVILVEQTEKSREIFI